MSDQNIYTGTTRLVLAFDIGTIRSGISYSILEHGQAPQVHEVIRFPGQQEGLVKVPSLLYYDANGRVRAAGSEVLDHSVRDTATKDGWKKAERWKLHFRPRHLISIGADQDDRVPPLPSGKTAVDVLADFIRYLSLCSKSYIQSAHPGILWPSIQDSVEFVFTLPNGWEGEQRQQYRRAIEIAGLVSSVPDGRSRVRIITECEASLHYYVSNLVPYPSFHSEGVAIIDAGGGTLDSSMYLVLQNPISCKEIVPAECLLQRSACVDYCTESLFRKLSCSVREKIAVCIITLVNELAYRRAGSFFDNALFRKLYKKLKLLAQIIGGQFIDTTDAIKVMIEQQQLATTRIRAVFLVGGFSKNKQLHAELQPYCEKNGIKFFSSADHADIAVATGAVLSHINRSPGPPLITSRVPRRSSPQIRPVLPSAARDRWEDQKRTEGVENVFIDKIMDMIGLEDVKRRILAVKGMIDVANRQGIQNDNECFDLLLVGNPGTGKTTLARMYVDFLRSVGALRGKAFVESTGSELSFEGVSGAKALVEDVLRHGGGALFVDEAHQLLSEDYSGRQVLDFFLSEMDNRTGELVIIFAGHTNQMGKLADHNPGFSSRFPYQLRLSDYMHDEFMWMLLDLVKKHFGGWAEIEEGIQGLYVRIAIRRLIRGSGRFGFGNVHALRDMFSRIRERQAERLERERKLRIQVDDFLLAKEDLIGPDPTRVLEESASWRKLRELIGLESVKNSVRDMFGLMETNYQRELAEIEPMQVSLNRVFLGSPGTGKTLVAKLYGQILAELGMLSKGEVVVKNASDFVASHLGESESRTKAILESVRGKVLVIDEAHMLYNKSTANTFNTAVIDTLVAEIQNVPGEDRCVLLLGYKDPMEEMFQNVNPGLARRFAIENAFVFEDFTEQQLIQILELKLREQDLHASEEAKHVAKDVLSRVKIRPNFGNAGEVDNLLGQAKARYQKRMSSIPASQRARVTFAPEDFDANFSRSQAASENLDKIFADIVGCVELKDRLNGYQVVALEARLSGMDMQEMREIIPTNFVFKGPPGTGKTTIARKFGQIYFDMEFLASAEVVECSATDLVGEYVGHTGFKTKGIFEKALGKVLFIDEAYRLCEGAYAKEAIEEIIGLVTNERFMKKIVVILAGYEEEMNALLATNPGLSGRFSEEIIFPTMTLVQCLELLDQELRKKNIIVPELSQKSSDFYLKMQGAVGHMTTLPSWGSARDMKTLGEKMVREAYMNMAQHKKLFISAEDAFRITEDMLKLQQARGSTSLSSSSSPPAETTSDPPSFPQYTPPPQLSPAPVNGSTPSQYYNTPRQSFPLNTSNFAPQTHLKTFGTDLSVFLRHGSYLSPTQMGPFGPPTNIGENGV